MEGARCGGAGGDVGLDRLLEFIDRSGLEQPFRCAPGRFRHSLEGGGFDACFDPLAAAPEELGHGKVLLTVSDGIITHRA